MTLVGPYIFEVPVFTKAWQPPLQKDFVPTPIQGTFAILPLFQYYDIIYLLILSLIRNINRNINYPVILNCQKPFLVTFA